MTVENELLKINENLLLINSKRTENFISSEKLEDITDYSTDYIPVHLEWLKKGNNRISESLNTNNKLDREAFSQLIVGVRNLSSDLQDLSDLLIEISDEIDGVSPEAME